ncbi:MAG TPA: hypothetical protein VNN20_14335 [Thermodesulfobacteriota bacterium]|nr:hypothetical protein [Thermodesulfobacteriota bacterium]
MSKMNLPGFTAETSVYRSTGRYTVSYSSDMKESGIVPAMFRSRFCMTACLACAAFLVMSPVPDPGDFLTCGACFGVCGGGGMA